jgi:hypothetical protein
MLRWIHLPDGFTAKRSVVKLLPGPSKVAGTDPGVSGPAINVVDGRGLVVFLDELG